MRVKPSRGAVAFFVLLIVGGIVKYGMARHDQASFVEDAPPTQIARRLVRCLLGRDAQRMLGERTNRAAWTDLATNRLRRMAAAQFSREWPSRCEPLAQRLVERLAHTGASTSVATAADELNLALGQASRRRMEFLEAVESGRIGTLIAGMAFVVSSMSTGASAEWTGVLGPTPTDLVLTPESLTPTAPWPLASDALLPLPDLVLFQSPTTRTTHRTTFDAHEHPTTRALARGAPVVGGDTDGARWIADDEGDSLFLPEGEPASVIPLPDPIAQGDAVVQAWHTALTPRRLWLLTVEHGRVRLRSTPRTGEVAWSDVLATLGETDGIAGAALSVAPEGGERVVVEAVQRGGLGVSVVRWRIDADPTVTVSEPEAVAPEWPAFDVRVQACVRGPVREFLVTSDEGLTLVNLSGPHVLVQPMLFRDLGTPTGDRLDLACGAGGVTVLLGTEHGNVLLAPNGEQPWEILAPPLPIVHMAIVGAVPTDHEGVVVLADDGSTLRAFRHTVHVGEDGIREGVWDGGVLLAMQTQPSASAEGNVTDVVAMAGEGDQVAALVRLRVGTHLPESGRLASRDGGRTWHGLQ